MPVHEVILGTIFTSNCLASKSCVYAYFFLVHNLVYSCHINLALLL